MLSWVHGLHFNNIRGDLYGGLVAAVVALPLALAFGVTSGLGAIAGLYGAIFVGFFAALFGGTPAQASGPTGPMTVVMAGIILNFADEPALAFTAVILGGVFQVLFGLMGFGRYITLVPYPVISGFMSGIGGIILILQVAPFLGLEAKSKVVANLMAMPDYLQSFSLPAMLVGSLTLAIVYFTPPTIGKRLPPVLLALIVGTMVAEMFFPTLPVIGDIPTGFPTPIWPAMHINALVVMVEEALVLALLGTIDSLLTSLVCDNMTRTQHDSNRELIGQGIGNMAAGFFGGLPGAGATMRSVANIRTGGRTPLSGMFMAVVLLGTLLGLGPLAEKIPLAVLAGLLIKVGIDIIDWRFLKHMAQAPRTEVLVMIVVLLVTVLVDLITAVGIGVVLASVMFVKRMADLELENLSVITGASTETPLSKEEQRILNRNRERIIMIHVNGPMSFGSAKDMVRRLESVKSFNTFSSVILDLTSVPSIDGTAALAIEDMVAMVKTHQQDVFFVGMRPGVARVLKGLGVLHKVPPEHRYPLRLDALRHAAYIGGSTHPYDVPPTEIQSNHSIPS
ncbi:SulP family inorganic anion transporter [Candidatus Nitrospira allomarina]|uniref:SulP family inorganic anion transporter n=1 Tax=Candidatus Nitrospira allomarina TaxID=3020900 RepID=A0AA96GKK5_9BACT|nr:SulP family inorganic anion transporter [Candidatus Nitrospira allomarina]WNM59276.1 SulP family inorganic anion transporter [Candidatus Nitrospira allomarina]